VVVVVVVVVETTYGGNRSLIMLLVFLFVWLLVVWLLLHGKGQQRSENDGKKFPDVPAAALTTPLLQEPLELTKQSIIEAPTPQQVIRFVIPAIHWCLALFTTLVID